MARTTERTSRSGRATDRVRTRAGRLVRVVLTVCAAMLAVGALLVALRHNINSDNPIVRFVTGFDDTVDGPFSRQGGLFRFDAKNATSLEALVNWGIAAIVYLAAGRVLERVVRP